MATLPTCRVCGQPKREFVSRTEKNPGRRFAKCPKHGEFEWLDNISSSAARETTRRVEISSHHSDSRVALGAGENPPSSPQAVGYSLSPALTPHSTTAAGSAMGQPLDALLEPDDAPAVEAPERKFSPSRYQTAIYNFLESGSGNAVVMAGPGSGKTTTLKHAAPYLPDNAKVAAIAFNKRNARDLEKVMPEWVRASTFHSLGLSNIRRQVRGVQVDERKVYRILNDLSNSSYAYRAVISEDASIVNQLVSLCKNTLTLPDPESLVGLASHYGVSVNGNADAVYEIAGKAFDRSQHDLTTVDFDDMIYLPAIGHVACEPFDFLLIDETQDLNKAQIEFALRSTRPNSRVLAVGDRKQSIYGFRGAALDAVDNVIAALSATTLPLSITYRMPKRHVDYVNRRFPHEPIEAREGAPDGIIDTVSHDVMLSRLVDGDMVVCRCNAPLVAPCFELIRKGVKATIAGRDIGKGLLALLEKAEKRYGSRSLPALLAALMDYAQREAGKLLAAHKGTQAQSLLDQAETLVALADGCNVTSEIAFKVNGVFSDDAQGVTFSSVHRAKGLEADNVYLLKPDLIPHPMAQQDWEKAQEQNILYVALTRSKHGLYFVP